MFSTCALRTDSKLKALYPYYSRSNSQLYSNELNIVPACPQNERPFIVEFPGPYALNLVTYLDVALGDNNDRY